MSRAGEKTRQSILNSAQRLIIGRGFAGASIDRIILDAGITKGAFFYHFKSKAKLAEALFQRYIDHDLKILRNICETAERMSDDPKQRVLIILGLYAEMLDSMQDDGYGCLYASYAYQQLEFPTELGPLIRSWVEDYTTVMRPYYQAAMTEEMARQNTTADDLITQLMIIFEGAFVIANVKLNVTLPGNQLRLYRAQLEALFKL